MTRERLQLQLNSLNLALLRAGCWGRSTLHSLARTSCAHSAPPTQPPPLLSAPPLHPCPRTTSRRFHRRAAACWEKNTARSFSYLALDVGIVAGLAILAFNTAAWWAWPLYWFAQGTMFWALFVVGHDW